MVVQMAPVCNKYTGVFWINPVNRTERDIYPSGWMPIPESIASITAAAITEPI
jgi:hypothetical protein